MLDGILGHGFTSKCKSLIKLTKCRIDVIRRKKKATLKFLKKDIADLLANGLDINAYGRAEGLLVELSISSCYDFLEQSCDTVLKHLPIMQKQRECPEECREGIASLMYAAARFSDFPELRELRQIFQERFGACLDHLENRKFVEDLDCKSWTVEKRVQLLKEIALEYSIKWDSLDFENRMSTPPPYPYPQGGVPKDFGSYNAALQNNASHPKDIDPTAGKDATIDAEGKQLKLPRNRHEKSVYDYENANLKFDGRINHYGEKSSSSSSEVLEAADDVHNNGREQTVASYSKSSSPFDYPGVALSGAGLHLKSDIKHPSSTLPPPYVKSNSTRKVHPKDRRGGHLELPRTSYDNSCVSIDPRKHVAGVVELESRHSDHERQVASPMNGGEMDHVFDDAQPKPRSVRRRHQHHHKPRSSHSVEDNAEEDVRTARMKSRSSSRRRDDKRGLQLLVGEENEKDEAAEEERIIDKLLIHYSKKSSTSFEPGKMRRKPNNQADTVPSAARSVSLPRERHHDPSDEEAAKVYTRAASFQPDRLSEAKHVHPKLPDYDDLAARFAAFRGR